jgi:heme-degrading monooxygenase HmoA
MDRWAVRTVDGLVLGRVLGTARSTAGGADLGRWAFVGVWEDEAALDRFEASHPLAARWRETSVERWSARLAPRRSRGRWAGVEPFAGEPFAGGGAAAAGGAVAVLTRATVRPARIPAFLRSRRPVDGALQRAPGLLRSLGMGEWPVGRQGTFSVWRDDADVRSFWHSPLHADVIRRTRQERWYAEEWFAAFSVLRHTGTWDGADPLT